MSFRHHIAVFFFSLTVGLAPQAVMAQASAPAATQEAAPAAPAVPAPPAAAVTKETVDNPYGLKALWEQGDFVAKGTLIIMILMSMGSWYILITKLYESLKISGEARVAREQFFKAASLKEGAAKLKDRSAFRYIADVGIAAGEHHEGHQR